MSFTVSDIAEIIAVSVYSLLFSYFVRVFHPVPRFASLNSISFTGQFPGHHRFCRDHHLLLVFTGNHHFFWGKSALLFTVKSYASLGSKASRHSRRSLRLKPQRWNDWKRSRRCHRGWCLVVDLWIKMIKAWLRVAQFDGSWLTRVWLMMVVDNGGY